MPFYVKVPFKTADGTEPRVIPVAVQNKQDAITHAKAHNPGPEFLWDQAEVEEGD